MQKNFVFLRPIGKKEDKKNKPNEILLEMNNDLNETTHINIKQEEDQNILTWSNKICFLKEI